MAKNLFLPDTSLSPENNKILDYHTEFLGAIESTLKLNMLTSRFYRHVRVENPSPSNQYASTDPFSMVQNTEIKILNPLVNLILEFRKHFLKILKIINLK